MSEDNSPLLEKIQVSYGFEPVPTNIFKKGTPCCMCAKKAEAFYTTAFLPSTDSHPNQIMSMIAALQSQLWCEDCVISHYGQYV